MTQYAQRDRGHDSVVYHACLHSSHNVVAVNNMVVVCRQVFGRDDMDKMMQDKGKYEL